MIAYLGEKSLHAMGILMVDDVNELSQILTNLSHLTGCIWIEENLLQEIIILIEHTLGYLHMALEGGTRSILMLHHSRESKSAHEWDTQGVSHRLVVLIKCILMQAQT